VSEIISILIIDSEMRCGLGAQKRFIPYVLNYKYLKLT